MGAFCYSVDRVDLTFRCLEFLSVTACPVRRVEGDCFRGWGGHYATNYFSFIFKQDGRGGEWSRRVNFGHSVAYSKGTVTCKNENYVLYYVVREDSKHQKKLFSKSN